MKKLVSLSVLTALVAGCANMGGSTSDYGSENLAEETLVTEVKEQDNNAYLLAPAPRYYIGNAYKVEDVQYIPAEDMEYNQTGVAGIIPMELNGNKTSNGEVYDSTQLLATSKTLPLPTIARVTNLENGESVIVRVNNRGPFVNSRIVDLSPAAAEKLDMIGNTKVQVQVLAEQSNMVKEATVGKTVVVEPAVAEEPVAEAPVAAPAPVAVAPAGEYSVQVAAFYAEDSANSLLQKMKNYGDAIVVKEGDMFKVRIVNLDAAGARRVIDALRSSEGMAPGLLKNGRWVNADSI
ncbi:MAG: septal ring lytic transglycosylase RlpA family protein [Alphaproteobacteria bacterium]|nr:septal ring lytic transglycosylase RlpA family protein [Alphaproteobacteria bacterium]